MYRLSKVCTALIKVLFVVVIGYLFLVSIYSTSHVTTTYTTSNEHVYYVRDRAWIHMLVLALAAAVSTLIYIGARRFRAHHRLSAAAKAVGAVLRVAVPLAVFAGLIYWIKATVPIPSSDQGQVYFAAQIFSWGDYSQLEEGGYIFIYPNQTGLMLLEAVVFRVLGEDGIKGMMALNALSLVILFILFQKITRIILDGKKSIAPYISFLAASLWLPLSFYVVFVYGNLIGLMLSVLGFWLVLRYLQFDRLWYAAAGVLCIAAAAQVKNNYLIAFLAVLVLLLLDAIRTRRWKPLLAAAVSVAIYLAVGSGVTLYVERVSGVPANEGVPAEAWIAMGLQENDELANGWYNAYNITTYKDCGYDTEATAKVCRENIKESLRYMRTHPKEALRFWGTKIASQWNDPTFQCFWIYNNKRSEGNHIQWAQTIFCGNRRLVELLNYLQSMILGGTLLYLLCNWRKLDLPQLLLPIYFLGGFFFHLLWEAKAQYTFTYFAVLIPYAVLGFRSIAEEAAALRSARGGADRARKLLCILAIMIALVAFGALPTAFAQNTWQLEQESELYQTKQWE
jgi:hypothetical protein